eukprot:2646610-Rhodomonas_salina.1
MSACVGCLGRWRGRELGRRRDRHAAESSAKPKGKEKRAARTEKKTRKRKSRNSRIDAERVGHVLEKVRKRESSEEEHVPFRARRCVILNPPVSRLC